MRTLIGLALANFTLTFFVIGLIVAAVAVLRAPPPRSAALVVEKLIAWHVFFAIGAAFLLNFVLPRLLRQAGRRLIGWQDSPFQFEVATASLGFSIVAFLAAFRSFDLRLAAIVGPAIFLLGAAAGHLRQMLVAGNFAPGNAGTVFWTDILIPLFGLALLWLQARHGRRATAA